MFHYIEGTVSELEPNMAVIDCSGVGFALNSTKNTISALSLGEKAKLYISESIGESNFDLYGFASKGEKRCFDMLVSVSGIGPKAAVSILSYNTPENLSLAIINGDEKALTVAPGVGKKIAQRVILELKDKVSKEMEYNPYSPQVSSVNGNGKNTGAVNDAIAALTVLGYGNGEIAPIINTLDVSQMTAEQIIKSVLKHMVK